MPKGRSPLLINKVRERPSDWHSQPPRLPPCLPHSPVELVVGSVAWFLEAGQQPDVRATARPLSPHRVAVTEREPARGCQGSSCSAVTVTNTEQTTPSGFPLLSEGERHSLQPTSSSGKNQVSVLGNDSRLYPHLRLCMCVCVSMRKYKAT